MGFTALVAALALLATVQADPEFRVVRRTSLEPARSGVPLPAAQFSVPFGAKAPRRKSKKEALQKLRGKGGRQLRFPSKAGGGGKTVVVDGSDFDDEYLTNVTIGGQKFSLIIDTGSSDTWVAQKGFNCFDLDHNPVPQETCAFGTNGFDTARSTTFKPFPNVSFNITYGDGEFLSGPVGFDTVSIGALTVKGQEIGVPTLTAWEGDGINTGLIGLAFSGLTSVYNTTDPTKASGANNLPYDPLFVSAVKQHAVRAPFFSIALDRGTLEQQENDPFDPNLGFLSFGGIAPVPVTSTSVTVPVQGYSTITFEPAPPGPDTEFFFYTVDVQSYTFPGSRSVVTANNNTILDTGTTLNFVPDDVAAAYNAAFRPPAELDEDFGLYLVPCNATVPPFVVNIGGKGFSVDGRDQLLPLGTDDDGTLICATGTQPGGPNTPDDIFILGDVFLHNVVSTYNPIAGQVTLTERQKY